ncbi:MAG: hypothetical protein A2007_01805 [Verrucomicrobia bacterium GWC2_42_7]|nr:MAG: hypothetical protein A2007_01805 [Verrucomicrobia bacterium GWC2_42_7]
MEQEEKVHLVRLLKSRTEAFSIRIVQRDPPCPPSRNLKLAPLYGVIGKVNRKKTFPFFNFRMCCAADSTAFSLSSQKYGFRNTSFGERKPERC